MSIRQLLSRMTPAGASELDPNDLFLDRLVPSVPRIPDTAFGGHGTGDNASNGNYPGNPSPVGELSWNDLPWRIRELQALQKWQTVALQVDPEASSLIAHWETLWDEIPPYKVAVDFTAVDPNQRFRVRVHVWLFDPSSTRADKDTGFRWELAEDYLVYTGKPNSTDAPQLMVNENPTGALRILMIDAPDGPWRCRVSIAQSAGTSKVIRYLVY